MYPVKLVPNQLFRLYEDIRQCIVISAVGHIYLCSWFVFVFSSIAFSSYSYQYRIPEPVCSPIIPVCISRWQKFSPRYPYETALLILWNWIKIQGMRTQSITLQCFIAFFVAFILSVKMKWTQLVELWRFPWLFTFCRGNSKPTQIWIYVMSIGQCTGGKISCEPVLS